MQCRHPNIVQALGYYEQQVPVPNILPAPFESGLHRSGCVLVTALHASLLLMSASCC